MVHFRSVLLSVLSCVLLFANAAAAQQCYPSDTREYDGISASAEARLTQLEKIADVVLEQGAMSDKDGTTVDELTNAYASDMMKAYQLMSNAAERASSSQGKDGDTRLVTDFELLASQHQTRTIALALKWEKINAGIAQGEIKGAWLDLPAGAPSPVDRITQEGQMKLTSLEVLKPDFVKLALRVDQDKSSLSTRCGQAASVIGNLLVPSAEASQVIKCVNVCRSQNWSACWNCIKNGAPSVINAYNSFVSCWNSAGECKWSKPWNCAKKAWCLAQFIAVLA